MDEVNDIVDKDIAREAIAEHIRQQRLRIKGMPIPYDVGLEVGNRWGECFPFKLNQDTGEVLEPDGDFVHVEHEIEVKEEPVSDELTFDFDLED